MKKCNNFAKHFGMCSSTFLRKTTNDAEDMAQPALEKNAKCLGILHACASSFPHFSSNFCAMHCRVYALVILRVREVLNGGN